MLNSAMKQNCKPFLKSRWSATSQKLFKTEGSFENRTALRWQNCHQC